MRYKLITEYLEETAAKYPDKIAVVDEQSQVPFRELRSQAFRVAEELMHKGVFKKPVAVLMEKGAACFSAFLGVAYSGNFYTPIDSKMPLERAEKILDTLEPACLIVSESCREAFADLIRKYPVISYEEAQRKPEVCEAEILALSRQLVDADVLYVLFTSGSTGVPKGVIISHRSVIDYIEWVADTFQIQAEDRFANQAPFYFDNSILDLYTSIKTGSTLYIIPEKLFTFPIQLLEYLDQNKITTIFWVPSALCLVANLKALGKVKLDHLKRILFCGEPMPNKQLNLWRKAYPAPLYANLYGPTEITDVCTYYIVDREFDDAEPLPIGYPCNNTDILVLDDHQQLVTKDSGGIGELCVRGTSLSYGYYRNEEKTKEAFIQNPLHSCYAETIYRTGDLVKYNEHGELIFLSRKDFQIKHMGHRIELGEIENAVISQPEVRNCCCLYDDKRKKIVLFYEADGELTDLKTRLKNKVPDYMIPSVVKRLDAMPLNLNGKIDRNQLKQL